MRNFNAINIILMVFQKTLFYMNDDGYRKIETGCDACMLPQQLIA